MIAVLSSLGQDKVSVYRRPVVSIISTGDELKAPGQKLAPGQIYESNSLMLEGQIRQLGGIPLRFARIPDDSKALEDALEEAAKRADLIITSGGASVGDFDLVPKLVEKRGTISFWKVAIKPGKPLAFGSIAQLASRGGTSRVVTAIPDKRSDGDRHDCQRCQHSSHEPNPAATIIGVSGRGGLDLWTAVRTGGVSLQRSRAAEGQRSRGEG